jgi:hypothetical protein
LQVSADSDELEPLTTRPNVVWLPAATDPLYPALTAVTCVPVWVTAALHELAMVSAASPNMKPADQPVIGAVPVFRTVSWSWYPPGHELLTDEVSAQAPAPPPLELGVGDGDTTGPADVV